MEKIRKYFVMWRSYGIDEEKILRYVFEIQIENVKALRNMSLMSGILILSLCWFPVVTKNSYVDMAVYIVMATIAFGIHMLAKAMDKNRHLVKNNLLYLSIIILFMHLGLGYGIYIGVISNPGHVAVLYMIILVWVESNFIMTAVDNFCIALSSVLIFCTLSYLIKERTLYTLDITNCMVAFCFAMINSWTIGRFRLQHIILTQELNAVNAKLYLNSIVDPLTGLYNRRKFMDSLKKYLDKDSRTIGKIAVGIMDIDYFKKYNDAFGHDEGDKVLIDVAGMLLHSDFSRIVSLCRWGGEEFMCILMLKEDERVEDICDQVLKGIRAIPSHMKRRPLEGRAHLTASIGVCTLEKDKLFDWNTVYKKTDKALYEAKLKGRDCVVIKAMGED